MPSQRIQSTLRRHMIASDKALRDELRLQLLDVGGDVKEYLEDVTADWKNKPTFALSVTVQDNRLAVTVYPQLDDAGKIFNYVDRGTGKYGAKGQPYKIRPKAPGYPLRFQGGYSAKTAPSAQYGVGTGKASGDWVATYEVTHPGIEAREFRMQALKNISPEFSRRVNNALRRRLRQVR